MDEGLTNVTIPNFIYDKRSVKYLQCYLAVQILSEVSLSLPTFRRRRIR